MSKVPPRPPARRVVEMLIDYACSAKCPFCYNPPLTPQVLSKRLSLRGVAELLYRKRAEGYDGAWFTGGEATQRPDLPAVLRSARKLGFSRIQIGTNGIRAADPAYARKLAGAGLNYARVSLHACEPAIHDRILGVRGAFVKAVRALDALRDAGVAVGINFVLCRYNLENLPEFAWTAVKEWKVEDMDFLFPHQRGMMELNSREAGLRYREARPWVERAFERLARGGPVPSGVRLVNFPPCALPRRLRPRISDWKREDYAGHELALPDGRAAGLEATKSGQKRQGAGCGGCALEGRCGGFEAEYALRYGEEEFRRAAA